MFEIIKFEEICFAFFFFFKFNCNFRFFVNSYNLSKRLLQNKFIDTFLNYFFLK